MPPFKSYFSFHGFRNHCRKFFCSRTDLCSQQHSPLSLDNVGSMTSLLKSRSVIRLRGPDTVKFLQGLVTNDVKRFAESPSESSYLITPNVPVLSVPPIYTAILTPQGRFLYDLFIYRPPRADEKLDSTGSGPGPAPDDGIITLLADVDTSVVDEILDCFKKYRLRSKVEIDNVAEEFYCWQRFGSAFSNEVSSEEPDANAVGWGGSIDKAGVSSTQGNDFGWRWFRDPRLNSLGFRGIFPTNMTPPLVESDKDIDEEYYLLWRLQKGVAEGSTEIPKGEAIPLEYNLVGLNAISFDKGCYVGQEFVARTHHRGVIRKRLIPLIFVDNSEKESQMKVAAGSEVVNSASGKKVGIITKTLGSRGMGLLKLEDSLEETSVLVIRGQDDVKVKIIWPEWWPEEWIQGET